MPLFASESPAYVDSHMCPKPLDYAAVFAYGVGTSRKNQGVDQIASTPLNLALNPLLSSPHARVGYSELFSFCVTHATRYFPCRHYRKQNLVTLFATCVTVTGSQDIYAKVRRSSCHVGSLCFQLNACHHYSMRTCVPERVHTREPLALIGTTRSRTFL